MISEIDAIGQVGESYFRLWATRNNYKLYHHPREIFCFFCNISEYIKECWSDADSFNKNMVKRDILTIKNSSFIKNKIEKMFTKDEINFLKRNSTNIMNVFGGIPDYFIYNHKDKIFCEIKTNNAKLREKQKKVLSILSQKFKANEVHINISEPEIKFIPLKSAISLKTII